MSVGVSEYSKEAFLNAIDAESLAKILTQLSVTQVFGYR